VYVFVFIHLIPSSTTVTASVSVQEGAEWVDGNRRSRRDATDTATLSESESRAEAWSVVATFLTSTTSEWTTDGVDLSLFESADEIAEVSVTSGQVGWILISSDASGLGTSSQHTGQGTGIDVKARSVTVSTPWWTFRLSTSAWNGTFTVASDDLLFRTFK